MLGKDPPDIKVTPPPLTFGMRGLDSLGVPSALNHGKAVKNLLIL